MKKKYLLIILILIFLTTPCGCKKEDKKDIEKDIPIVNIENNNNADISENDEEITASKNQDSSKEEPIKNDNIQNAENNVDNKENNIDNKNNSNNNNDNKENNTTSNNNSSTNNVEPEKDEISILRDSIQNTYGVTIKYGDEIGNYHPKGLTPTRMLDKDEIKTYLNYTKNELAKYPNGFFMEMKNFGMPLTIFLVTSVPNNSFAGYTDREFTYDIKITVVKGYDFAYTLNHEIMHYIDAYLECKMYPNNPYDEYMALNPPGYNYGSYISRYNFGYSGADKEVYFMDDYGQTNVREDRAQVFRQMISRSYKLSGMFDDGTVLQSKALVIDKQIRQYYSSATGTLTWDRFIK